MRQRDLSFDILRAIAIILVIFIHVNGIGFINESSPLNFNVSLIARQFSNFAVPLFLTISGYFMANKVFKSKTEYFNYLKKTNT